MNNPVVFVVVCLALEGLTLGCQSPTAPTVPLTLFERLAFADYMSTKSGASTAWEDYTFIESNGASAVEVDISPKRSNVDEPPHAGGFGRFGYDECIYIDKKTLKVVKRTIGS